MHWKSIVLNGGRSLVVVLSSCGDPAPAPSTLPCDVATVLHKCQTCHTVPPRNGAPISLVTYEDTQRLYRGDPVWKLMGRDVKSGRMPLAIVTLDQNERDAVVRWSEAGGQPGASCPE